MFYTKHCFLKLLHASLLASTLLNGFSRAADLDCMIKPDMYIELSSPVAGVLETVFVEKGDHVSKGQVLAQLEASIESARVDQAKLDAFLDSDLHQRKVQLEYAIRNRDRYKGLILNNSISQIEKDKVETEVALAEIEMKKAREQKKSAALSLALANAQLQIKTIKSPIDGIVIDRYAMIGESVNDRAIMKLAQINPLRVELIAPTEYFGIIKQGMEVDIRPERPANKVFKATVSTVDQLIDPASGSFSVRLALPNPDDEVVGGVNCLASFDFQTPAVSASPEPPVPSIPPDSLPENYPAP